MCGGVHDVITANKFHKNESKVFALQGSQNWGLPLTWPVALANCDSDMEVAWV